MNKRAVRALENKKGIPFSLIFVRPKPRCIVLY